MELGDALFAQLEGRARTSPRGRQHLNLHADYDEPCQKLLNALTRGSYIQPHRHRIDPKVECLVALKGRFGCILFDDEGRPLRTYLLGPNEDLTGIQIEPHQWHTLFAMDTSGILLEVKSGPFKPNIAKEPAPWAPEEGSPQALSFLEHLRSLLHRLD